MACGDCKLPLCSRACQRAAWPSHKLVCGLIRSPMRLILPVVIPSDAGGDGGDGGGVSGTAAWLAYDAGGGGGRGRVTTGAAAAAGGDVGHVAAGSSSSSTKAVAVAGGGGGDTGGTTATTTGSGGGGNGGAGGAGAGSSTAPSTSGSGGHGRDADSGGSGGSGGSGTKAPPTPPPPPLPPVLLRSFASKGQGLGLVAARDLLCGELLFAEPPLVAGKRKSDSDAQARKRIMKAVAALPDAKKAAFFALHGGGGAGAGDGGAAVALRIMRGNGYPLQEGVGGMFPLTARINHACTPNVHHIWAADRHARGVFAARDIRAGEQLTCRYGDASHRATRGPPRH